MKRLLMLGGWAVAGAIAVPQMIRGIGGKAANPPAVVGGAQGGGGQAAGSGLGNGLHVHKKAVVGRNGASGGATVNDEGGSAGAGASSGSGSESTGLGSGSGCSSRGLQILGGSNANGNAPNSSGKGLANADARPRCAPGIGLGYSGTGSANR